MLLLRPSQNRCHRQRFVIMPHLDPPSARSEVVGRVAGHSECLTSPKGRIAEDGTIPARYALT